MSPHPHILKRDFSPFRQGNYNPLPFSSCEFASSPHVHFPPTPGLVSMHPVHSPQTYDRAPISVSPNVCQLPGRDTRKLYSPSVDLKIDRRERGHSQGRRRKEDNVKGSYFHPRAYEACEPEHLGTPSTPLGPPPLIHDLSPSEDWEDMIMTPPDPAQGWLVSTASPNHTTPLLNAYATSFIRTAESARRPDDTPCSTREWVAGSGEQKEKPHLLRIFDEVFAKRASRFDQNLDEGCLGGF